MVPSLIFALFVSGFSQKTVNVQSGPSAEAADHVYVYTPQDLPDLTEVTLGGYTTLLQTGVNTFKQWGINHGGADVEFPETVESISCGGYFCLAVSHSGHVYEWGQISPDITTSKPKLVEELAQYRIKKVSTGFKHSIALTDEGAVYGWGEPSNGKLASAEALLNNPYIRPTRISSVPDIKDISCGGDHTILLDTTGSLWSFGSNNDGQLGRASALTFCNTPMSILGIDDEIKSISAGGDHSLVLTTTGKVYSFGWGEKGQLGHGNKDSSWRPKLIKLPKGETPFEIATGGYAHSIILSETGFIYAFGLNDFYQLGFNSESNEVDTPIKTDFRDIVKIYGGGYKHTAAKTLSGDFIIFGDNGFGQLGPKYDHEIEQRQIEMAEQLKGLGLSDIL